MKHNGVPGDALSEAAAAIAAAGSPSDVFRRLVEGARCAAPRAMVLLLRRDRFQGWGSSGYDAEDARRLREFSAPRDAGWLGRVAGAGDDRPSILEAGERGPEFGQPSPGASAGVPLRLGGRTIALLLAERDDAGEPWQPSILVLLATVARLRLELDLALRRQGGAAATPRAVPPEAPAPVPGPRDGESSYDSVSAAGPAVPAVPDAPYDPAAAGGGEDPEETALAPHAGEPDEERDRARRYARLIATDLKLYNEESVVLGRRNRDLSQRLHEPMLRGKDAFLRRHPELGPEGLRILRAAYVQVLAGGEDDLVPALDTAAPSR